MSNSILYTRAIINTLANSEDMANKAFLQKAYLDYVNNFISSDGFREHYDFDSVALTKAVINYGRTVHEELVVLRK